MFSNTGTTTTTRRNNNKKEQQQGGTTTRRRNNNLPVACAAAACTRNAHQSAKDIKTQYNMKLMRSGMSVDTERGREWRGKEERGYTIRK